MGNSDDELSSLRLTDLLRIARGNDENMQEARERAYDRVEKEIRMRVRSYLSKGRPDSIVATADVMHSVFMRLVNDSDAIWEDRSAFYGHASRIIRNILVEYYRRRMAQKRGGSWQRIPLDPDMPNPGEQSDFMALHESLERLAEDDPVGSTLIEQKFFLRMNNEELSKSHKISVSTIQKKLRVVKARLRDELRHE